MVDGAITELQVPGMSSRVLYLAETVVKRVFGETEHAQSKQSNVYLAGKVVRAQTSGPHQEWAQDSGVTDSLSEFTYLVDFQTV